MPDFEWRQDEVDDEVWDEIVVPPSAPSRRWRLYLLAVLAALLVVGSGGYYWLDQRAAATADSLGEQVRASYRLFHDVAERGDGELFTTLLSGRDLDWARVQYRLLQRDLLLNRPALGLAVQSTRSRPTVTFSPDFKEAEVRWRQTYVVQPRLGVTATTRLQQTVVFRRGSGRWLLTVPLAEFWGPWREWENGRLTLIYPQRDAEIARRLVRDLAADLERLCRHLTELPCPDGLDVTVHLHTNPATLLQVNDRDRMLGRGDYVILPAPSLVGVPQDEMGYAALRRGYSNHMVGAVIGHLVGWQGEQPLFHRAFVDRQLAVLGLREWPMAATDYEALLDRPFNLQTLSHLWNAPTDHPGWVQVYAFVDFLGEQSLSAQTIGALHRGMVEMDSFWRTDSFWRWVGLWVNDVMVGEQVWQQFVYERSRSGQQAPPIPLPASDIRLWCNTGSEQGPELRRYDLASGAWQDEMLSHENVLIDALPNDRGYLVKEQFMVGNEPRWRALWLHEGSEAMVTQWRVYDNSLRSTGRFGPDGDKLVTAVPHEFNENVFNYLLFDVATCTGDNCRLLPIEGPLVWSPAGVKTIVMDDDAANAFDGMARPVTLWLGDAQGQRVVEIGAGYAPFWIDDQRFGYVRLNEVGMGEIVVGSVDAAGTERPRVVVALPQLLPAASDNFAQPIVTKVVVTPAMPDMWLVTVADTIRGQSFAFLLRDWHDPITIEQLPLTTEGEFVSVAFAPNGRWLMVNAIDRAAPQRVVYVYDSETAVTRTFTFAMTHPLVSARWTADSRWLLLGGGNFIKLWQPTHDYQQWIGHEFPRCIRVDWVSN